jgi:hypothetical protein
MWRAALAAACLAGSAEAGIVGARYEAPTDRYDHGILGDRIEWGALALRLADGRWLRLVLPGSRVFEDTAPRLSDIDGDGDAEVIVVESDLERGARLAIYDESGLVAATPFIGQRHRWLAPVGAADLDGDGAVELAFVDRPHLARVLRVWRYGAGGLSEVASLGGLTNHRIGEREITGGIRDCGGGPEMIVLDADRREIVAVRLVAGQLEQRSAGTFNAGRVRRALACR